MHASTVGDTHVTIALRIQQTLQMSHQIWGKRRVVGHQLAFARWNSVYLLAVIHRERHREAPARLPITGGSKDDDTVMCAGRHPSHT